jgi:hypothetical protein
MFISFFLNVICWHSKWLANSYPRLKDHKFFSQVDDIFQSRASLRLAETSELMIANWNKSSRAIKSIIAGLQTDGDQRGVWKIELQLKNNATPNTHILFYLKK